MVFGRNSKRQKQFRGGIRRLDMRMEACWRRSITGQWRGHLDSRKSALIVEISCVLVFRGVLDHIVADLVKIFRKMTMK